ncbi:DUF4129 domain-containing protein [Homoserinibacter sp. YIM 151385]|uniref:DUF4129 domain-containing protein n=1 Tax=Homoserinibacter sp. YIM 151385 TaxID=2985506 RepID=UPI0022F0A1C4|nr:DUF4129 domain-containing protein [Homoserinibacter sp. YIM 151385]WBU37809.1 DUF4129 domain-containing protein [Homoserinibacter sp. YIM 151385]
MIPREVPLDPDAEEARRLVLEELSKQEYREARPTWFDQLISGIADWLGDLIQVPGGDGSGLVAGLVLLAVVVVIGVIAFLVFGVPRLNRRSRAAGALFGEDDERTAAQLRRAAADAAAAGDWPLAVMEQFRALARGLAERTVVSAAPGLTAHGFARAAGAELPEHAAGLERAAGDFDGVRYLDRGADRDDFERLRALDEAVGRARPRHAQRVEAGA